MRRSVLLLSLLSLLTFAFCTKQEAPSPQSTPSTQPVAAGTQENVPAKVLAVLNHVRETGRPPEGYVGGRVFENREHSLPPGGPYHEYDVNPKIKGKNRGPERLVIDQTTGRAWYTPDHYRTFILIK